MSDPIERKEVGGLTNLVATPPERVQVRSRSSNVTRAAWRIEVTCDQGPGVIILVEVSHTEQYYRGDGTFLGWNQEQLAAAYRELLPKSTPSDPQLPQLG